MTKKRTEPYIATHLHNKGARLGLPIGGNFELTARCNFHCPMCYVHMSEEQVRACGKELTAKQWIEIARKAKEKGLIFALLTGGEPFVRKDFFEIYGAMKKMGLLISINSNGSMLDGEIRRRLLEDPPFRMNISLYGGNNETYRAMCGQPAFDKVVENIRALKEGGIDVSMNLSITPYNKQDLADIYRVSQELNVPVRASSYMYPSIRVNGEKYGVGDRLSAEEAAKCIVEWDTLRLTPEEFERKIINMRNLSAIEERECMADLDEGVKCRAGSSSFWITWNGKMYPCGMMPNPVVYPLEKGFDAAWEELREETRKIRTPSECASCPKLKVCSVCAAVCVTETGKFNQVPGYVCQYTEKIMEAAWEVYQKRNEIEDEVKEGTD